MKTALLGYGTVGKSVDELLTARKTGISVKTILRRPGKATGERMTDCFDEILADPEIDTIVEVLSGMEPALSYLREALSRGKNVVSANKAALAADFPALLSLAKEHGAHLLFEASCGGGIPWLENIKKASCFDRITALSGILNGTGNYILDRMIREGAEFSAILADAQALGYAEADPTADIGGFDVRNKALISCSLAYRAEIATDFPVCGIAGLPKAFLSGLLAWGKSLRLMMLSVRKDDRYALGVAPPVRPGGAIEAAVPLNYNCTSLTGDYVGTLKFYGQGAGGHPTADAVIQDLLQIRDQRAVDVTLTEKLHYDETLLSGTAYLVKDGDSTTKHGFLSSLCEEAGKAGAFLAFEPDEGILF